VKKLSPRRREREDTSNSILPRSISKQSRHTANKLEGILPPVSCSTRC
jgi:hypothetical protein